MMTSKRGTRRFAGRARRGGPSNRFGEYGTQRGHTHGKDGGGNVPITSLRQDRIVSRKKLIGAVPALTCVAELRMKSRDSLVRLKRFQVDEKRRRVTQIETMAADFLRIAADLEREIAAEEQKVGIADPLHFAYPTYARAARTRRENLVRSAAELKEQLGDAKAQLEDASADLQKAQGLEGREKSADRADFPAPSLMGESLLGLSAAGA